MQIKNEIEDALLYTYHPNKVDKIMKKVNKLFERPSYMVMIYNHPFCFTNTNKIKQLKKDYKLSKEELENVEFIKIKNGEII